MNWQNKIKAFLHDPPDKALKIAGHEDRRNYLLRVLGFKFDITSEFDWIASSMERIVPKTDVLIDFSRTDRDFHPVLLHPITGNVKRFEQTSESVLGLRKSRVDEVLAKVFDKEREIIERLKDDSTKKTYFRIWRFMKELIEKELTERELGKEIANLPADTRCPDHTIWDHLDASSAIYGAMRTPALLMFKLTPVQNFIKNARKERDLWAGSHLLSYLTFKAIKVVVNECGPDAVIFPHLRGQPLFDFEYLNYFGDFINRENLKLDIANIPNKFLAIVGFESVDDLKYEIRKAIDETLEDLFKFSVKAFGSVSDNVINYGLKVLQYYFNVTVCAIPADLKNLKAMIDKLPDNGEESVKKKYEKWLELIESFKYEIRIFDLYSLMFELLEEIVAIESRKFEKLEGSNAYKCSLCGELEIFGNREMWKNVDRRMFKENEILCPVCLVKRIYSNWFKENAKKSGIEVDVGFESVSEVALRKVSRKVIKEYSKNLTFYDIIRDTKSVKDVNCEKLVKKFYESIREILDKLSMPFNNYELAYSENLRDVESVSKTLGVEKDKIAKIKNVEKYLENARKAVEELEERIGKLPRYYAILMMDGDNMGRMLMGDEMKYVSDYLHPKVVDVLPQNVRNQIEKVKRLITPATHSAISRALAHFSINVVPKIVEKHRGELIYAGGDDVLALLPTDSALACAYNIWREFKKDWDGWNVLPAKTMSAGLLIVHYKHPLYDALDKVRELESKAKSLGRNAVAVGYLTRGGSYHEVVFNWSIVSELKEFVDLLLSEGRPRISRRIIYDIIENVENLPNDENAIKAYIKFELLRHYEGDEKEKRAKEFARKAIDLAKSIRVTLSSSDLEELKMNLSKVKLSRLNEKINEQISSNCFSIDAIKNVLSEFSIECDAGELYGSILKKQVRGLFVLLKVLRDCEFAGDVNED